MLDGFKDGVVISMGQASTFLSQFMYVPDSQNHTFQLKYNLIL